MDFEHIIKRLDWLDQEHRKEREAISALQQQATALDSTLGALTKQIKVLNKQMSEAETSTKRLSQFDKFLADQRSEMTLSYTDSDSKWSAKELKVFDQQKRQFETVTLADDEEVNKDRPAHTGVSDQVRAPNDTGNTR